MGPGHWPLLAGIAPMARRAGEATLPPGAEPFDRQTARGAEVEDSPDLGLCEIDQRELDRGGGVARLGRPLRQAQMPKAVEA